MHAVSWNNYFSIKHSEYRYTIYDLIDVLLIHNCKSVAEVCSFKNHTIHH